MLRKTLTTALNGLLAKVADRPFRAEPKLVYIHAVTLSCKKRKKNG